MVAIGASPMGCARPVFIPSGTEIGGQKYKEMAEKAHFPQMSAIAQLYGKGRLWSLQRDIAPSHKTRDLLDSTERHTP